MESDIAINFVCKDFNALSIHELYEILRLRQDIFVVEQDCPYLDCDNKDQNAWHVCAYVNDTLIAYARLLPKGISYPEHSSIGRVVTHLDFRNKKIGEQLMRYSIDKLKILEPGIDIKISSQVYIMKFYESLGFEAIGEEYLEDDIPHHAMVLYVEH